MAVLSVWQPFVPLGNFGTVRCGQRLESTLVTRLETAYRTVCHFVCLWPASFPGTLRPLGVSAPRICRVFAQKKVGIFDRWDMIG